MKRGHLPTSASKRSASRPLLSRAPSSPSFGTRVSDGSALPTGHLILLVFFLRRRSPSTGAPHRRARAHPMGAGARSQRRLGPMGAARAIRHVVRKAPHISEPARRPGSRHNPERVDAATRTGNPDLNTHSQHTPPAAAATSQPSASSTETFDPHDAD
ncbi:hypothetical protein MTO96_037484 [Rhipicephalus appendiculatus]